MNLETEKAEVKSYIRSRVAAYEGSDPVTFVQLGYQTIQGGLFSVYFNSETDGGPDGSWTLHLQEDILERPHWEIDDGEDDSKALMIGEMIKSAFEEARNEGVFRSLHSAADADCGIEELSGIFGWPAWEDRKTCNLIKA